MARSSLTSEALRVNARYVDEVVIGWNLCPWAARAWRDGQVTRRVFLDPEPDVSAVAAFAGELAEVPSCAVGLAIFPRGDATVNGWERFAERVRRARGGPFFIAAFHPFSLPFSRPSDAPVTTPGELTSFIRRTPDPTLQLVRASLIEGLAREGRDLSDEIARDNFATATTGGLTALERLIANIRTDRDRAYALCD